MREKLLIVDDEPGIVEMMASYFAPQYQVLTAHSGAEALEKAGAGPDLILLDINMPGMDGLTVCQTIRDHIACPILFLTARIESADKIAGFQAGADDYIVKPFSPGEVMARVRAVLRRIDRSGEEPGKLLQTAGLRVNLEDYSVFVDGRPVRLTKREVDMLWTLVHGRNRAYTREMLLDLLWGYDYYGDPRTVDSHMKRLRAKLDAVPHPAWEIRTIRNVGYKFEVLT